MFKADQQIPILITYGYKDNDGKDKTVERFNIASLEADFGYWVQDNALLWIGIFPGDLGLFKSQVNISEGDLVSVKRSSDSEQPIIRFYTKTASQEQLIAANPQYQSINLSNEDHVLGKLVSIVKMNHNYSTYKSIFSNKTAYDKSGMTSSVKTTESHVSIDHVKRIIGLLIDIDRNPQIDDTIHFYVYLYISFTALF